MLSGIQQQCEHVRYDSAAAASPPLPPTSPFHLPKEDESLVTTRQGLCSMFIEGYVLQQILVWVKQPVLIQPFGWIKQPVLSQPFSEMRQTVLSQPCCESGRSVLSQNVCSNVE